LAARFLVVGGGPTAVAAAAAAVDAGCDVTVIDPGRELDAQRTQMVDRLSQQLPEEWAERDLSVVDYRPSPGAGLGSKQWFGSDVVYQPDPHLDVHPGSDVGATPSFVRGGLSQVWGATMLPYAEDELARWPQEVRNGLDRGYDAVSRLVPVSGRHDDLERLYPYIGERQPALQLSSVASTVGRRLRRRRDRLDRQGVVAGQARVAIRSEQPAPTRGCVYCQRCLQGCVYGHIWSADLTLRDLRRRVALQVVEGTVLRVREEGETVVVEAKDADGEPFTLEGDRVFLAPGPLITAALLQRSGIVDGPVSIKDSQTVFLPFGWLGPVGDVGDEPSYTLSQLFVSLPGPVEAARRSQVQLYTYTSSLVDRARALRRPLALLPRRLLASGLKRVVIGIGYLHADDSRQLLVTQEGESHVVTAVEAPGLDQALKRWYRQLGRALGPSGLLPLWPLAEVTPAGGGYHFGASFPMTEGAAAGPSSDLLGRVGTSRRVHVVDSSVLPTVAAGAITYTAMANAWRIADEAARL
jgi:choline dehydrogenase-like flavoprotein